MENILIDLYCINFFYCNCIKLYKKITKIGKNFYIDLIKYVRKNKCKTNLIKFMKKV